MKNFLSVLAISGLIAFTACSPVPEGAGDVNSSDNNATSGETSDGGETGSMNNTSETSSNATSQTGTNNGSSGETTNGEMQECTPMTQAQVCADTCGMQSDGCSGTIDCGACPCEGGQPTQATCGVCDLGTPSCDGDDQYTCAQPPGLAAGLDCTAGLLYVDGDSTGQADGSLDAPFPTIAEALGVLEDRRDVRAILVGDAPTYEESTLTVVNGVSLIGGFNDEWRYTDTPQRINITPSNDPDGAFGIKAVGLDADTTIAGVTVTMAEATSPKHHYALYIAQSSGLTVEDATFDSATPLKGSDGEDGQNGGDGEDGADGVEGDYEYWTTPGSSENADCPATTGGGRGGLGYRYPQSGVIQPQDGFDGESAAGGDKGMDAAPSGSSGTDAPPFSVPAANGSGARRGGAVTDGVWVAGEARGESGIKGEDGSGGGGGGGAHETETTGTVPNCAANCGGTAPGPTGGTGGAGGCGGTEGEGGETGSGSFALFITNSQDIILEGSAFRGASGASGGTGGAGGEGGAGGKGGAEGNGYCFQYFISQNNPGSTCLPTRHTGGAGGDGADGQRGGHGGGGAGGDSFGAYCHQSTVTIGEGVTFSAAEGGLGGDSPGNRGEDGEAVMQRGCM